MGELEGGKLVTMLEEANLVEFLLELNLFLWRDVLEWSSVRSEVEANQLHDALAAHDVAAEMADDVNDLLRVIL